MVKEEIEWNRPPAKWNVEVTPEEYSAYYKSHIFPYFKKRIPQLELNNFIMSWLPLIAIGSFFIQIFLYFSVLPNLMISSSTASSTLTSSDAIWRGMLSIFVTVAITSFAYFTYSKEVSWENYFPSVIEKSINFIHPNLDYNARDYITFKDISASKIFSHIGSSEFDSMQRAGGIPTNHSTIKISKGEDLISGKVGDTTIAFSEVSFFHVPKASLRRGQLARDLAVGVASLAAEVLVNVAIHTASLSLGSGTARGIEVASRPSEVKFFSGVFAIVDFNKDFQCETFVIPKSSYMLNIKHSELSSNPELELENLGFEKFFNVYTNSQVGARYILTPVLMEQIMSFTSKFYYSKRHGNVFFSFVNSKMYIAVETYGIVDECQTGSERETRSHLDPKTLFQKAELEELKTGKVPKFVQNYYFDTTNFVGIVKDFDLNTRIWSKQLKKNEISKDTIYNLDGTVAYNLSHDKS